MVLDVATMPMSPPLATDELGVVRVKGSRITLDLVVEPFEEGCTPEEVVQQYPTLMLGDMYAIVAFYLAHREAVRAYLEGRARQAEAVERQVQPFRAMPGIRESLLARRPGK